MPRLLTRLVALAAAAFLLVGGSANATTIPIPTGIVAGSRQLSTECFETYCQFTMDIENVRTSGRVTVSGRGIQIVGTTSRMRYRWFEGFCPYPCGASTPYLAEPFSIKARTAGGDPFAATCTSGSILETFPDVNEMTFGFVYMPMWSAGCQGGTSETQGPFAFDFIIPEDQGAECTALCRHNGDRSRFAGLLVEA